MELGPERPFPLWFWGPNSIIVVFMDPLGKVLWSRLLARLPRYSRTQHKSSTGPKPKPPKPSDKHPLPFSCPENIPKFKLKVHLREYLGIIVPQKPTCKDRNPSLSPAPPRPRQPRAVSKSCSLRIWGLHHTYRLIPYPFFKVPTFLHRRS